MSGETLEENMTARIITIVIAVIIFVISIVLIWLFIRKNNFGEYISLKTKGYKFPKIEKYELYNDE